MFYYSVFYPPSPPHFFYKKMFRDWLVYQSMKKIGFEDVQKAIHSDDFLIINTLPVGEQGCLIKNTFPIEREEQKINDLLNQYHLKQKILLYGKNAADPSTEKKHKQLIGLGFTEICVYSGGLFEWLLLQDIFGEREFPTTRKELDLLKYRPSSIL